VRKYFQKLCCKILKKHIATPSLWSYNMKGRVNFYCKNCYQVVRSIPLDDFEHIDKVFYLLDATKNIAKQIKRRLG